ncbi:MAG TPA: hypothetical protein PKA13_00645 [Geminicoccaceae bacterium]|nr:hypothetical protein [Geminicoccaceae bacterium]
MGRKLLLGVGVGRAELSTLQLDAALAPDGEGTVDLAEETIDAEGG